MSQQSKSIFQSFRLGGLDLANRIVMAPMTRARAENRELIPGMLQAEYYAQRASAGLIITEACWSSREAIGALNVPGIFTEAQAEGWKIVTEKVHAAGGRIFVQIGHIGGASHPDHLDGVLPLAPSAVNPEQKSFTPHGFKDTVTPRAMTLSDIERTIADYAKATRLARLAGFDGIELHGSNVYLIPQFLNERFNLRQDKYGGTIEKRSQFVLDALEAMIAEWDCSRVALRLSPAFSMGGFAPTVETLPTYEYLVSKLSDLKLAYLHLVHPSGDLSGSPVDTLSSGTAKHFRKFYTGTIIANGGFTRDSASMSIELGDADLISFATAYIANPDLVERFIGNHPLAVGNLETYYQGGASGYIDYPFVTR